MIARRLLGPLICALCAGVAAANTLFWSRPPTSADGALLDRLVQARAIVFGSDSRGPFPVAIIAVDKRSLDSPELAPYPRAFLAPVWAKLTDELFKARARAIGFDEIFAYDANRFSPSFNLQFLEALGKHRGQVVLARSSNMLPASAFVFAAGPDALGLSELRADPDGGYRHVVSGYQSDSGFQPTFAAMVLRKAGVTTMPPEVLLAPRRPLEAIPTFALVDVLRCADRAPDAIAAAFSGKIVLVGGTLAEEDRRVSSGRFLERPKDGPMLAPCGLHHLGASNANSDTVSGIFLHGAAIEAVAAARITSTASPTVVAIVAAIAAAAGGAVGMGLAPGPAIASLAGIYAMLLTLALFALQFGLWIPVATAIRSVTLITSVSGVVRYLAQERTRKRIKFAFRHYLSRTVVKRPADNSKLKQK